MERQEDFADFLRRFLASHELTAERLAELLTSHGVKTTGSEIHKWIEGKRVPKPDHPRVDAFARMFWLPRQPLRRMLEVSGFERRLRLPLQRGYGLTDRRIEELTRHYWEIWSRVR